MRAPSSARRERRRGARARPRAAVDGGAALVAGVSTREPYVYASGRVRVAVVDYGCKRSILRRLAARARP
jgi:carbamoylphosphate synthase small subunit